MDTEKPDTIICESCGNPHPSEDMSKCDDCGNECCDDCLNRCERCLDVLCRDCVEPCQRCGAVYCDDCIEWDDIEEETVCEDCLNRGVEPDYHDPYANTPHAKDAYTFGIEIEIDGDHDPRPLRDSGLIAGWKPDPSLCDHGMEYQTQPLPWNAETLTGIERLIGRIEQGGCGECPGGHIHIRRTERQTPARWYHALTGIDGEQAARLNMRHLTEDRWCALRHNAYHGKCTAVNADHTDTIELRTFGAWDEHTVHSLIPALTWLHAMWRFLQHHPVGTLKARDIRRMSRVQADQAIGPTPTIRQTIIKTKTKEHR